MPLISIIIKWSKAMQKIQAFFSFLFIDNIINFSFLEIELFYKWQNRLYNLLILNECFFRLFSMFPKMKKAIQVKIIRKYLRNTKEFIRQTY